VYFLGRFKRKTIRSRQLNCPRRVQQHVDVAKVLRCHPRNARGCTAIPLAVVFTPDKWAQKFGIKPSGLIRELVVSGRRLIFSKEFFFKTGSL